MKVQMVMPCVYVKFEGMESNQTSVATGVRLAGVSPEMVFHTRSY